MKENYGLDPKRVFLIALIGNKTTRQSKHGIGWFEVIEVTGKRPNLGTYPEYYKDFMRFIKTWFLLRPMHAPPPDLKDVFTISSRRPVTETLATSMSGHFFCERINR